MSTVAQYTPTPPEPLTQSGSSYVSNNGDVEVQFTQDASGNNVMQFTDLNRNTSVSWLPQDVKYIDSTGLTDFVYSTNNDASLFVSRNFSARYDGHFPDVEEYWTVQAGQVKHYATLTGDMRAPLPFLTDPQLAIGGILEFDPSFSIRSMGMVISGDFTTASSIDIVDANGQVVFTLPAIEVWDQAGNKTGGTFSVSFNGAGSVYVSMCVDYTWLSQDSIVYPVVIDPTVIVASLYSTTGNGGRKIVQLSNGWIVSSMYSATYKSGYPAILFYVSKDNGQTWNLLANVGDVNYYVRSDVGWAIASQGTIITLVYGWDTVSSGLSNGRYYSFTFDATTVALNNQAGAANGSNGYAYIENLPNAFGPGMSVAYDNSGNLHVAYVTIENAYPNSKNIRYSKGTVSGTTVTWATPTQITTQNTSGGDLQDPCIVINSSNNPVIFCDFDTSGSSSFKPAILAYIWNGSSWGPSGGAVVYQPGTYIQSNPCAAIDSNGTVHVVWLGKNATQATTPVVYYSKSTNGGSTWSTPTIISQTTSYYSTDSPTITINPSTNDLYVFYCMTTGSSSNTPQLWQNTYKVSSGAWSGPAVLTSSAYSQSGAQSLWSPFNMNSSDAVRYIWMSNQPQVDYGSIPLDNPPNAPILSSVSAFDATKAETLSWTFSDPDPGDSQSAYELQIVDVSSGTTVLDTGKVATTTTSYNLAANTLANGKQYQWRVQTWDSSGEQGPYSQYSTFNTAAAPTVQITAPTTGATDTGSSITVQWNYSDPANNAQATYDVVLEDANGNVLADSGVINDTTGTARAYTVQYTLANNTAYQVNVTVTNSQGISASSGPVSFSTSFTPPAPATTTATPDNANARIAIVIVNPAPSGSEPDVSYNDIYRRNSGASAWTRVATGVSKNATWYDYNTASGQAYDYKVTAIGNNGTQIDSTLVTQTLTLTGTWLHDVTNPTGTAVNLPYFYNQGSDGTTPNGEQWAPTVTQMQFAGRTLPVVEFGEQTQMQVTKGKISMFTTDGSWPQVKALIQSQNTLCVRDGRGRCVFGVPAGGYQETDLIQGQQFDLVFTEVDYSIAV